MNCVGIDVSKGKSTIAVMRPFGEVVVSPFEVCHTVSELSELARLLKSLDGETRVVMEATGNYHAPVAWLLHDAGLYVSVVNAILVHDYGNNSLILGCVSKVSRAEQLCKPDKASCQIYHAQEAPCKLLETHSHSTIILDFHKEALYVCRRTTISWLRKTPDSRRRS